VLFTLSNPNVLIAGGFATGLHAPNRAEAPSTKVAVQERIRHDTVTRIWGCWALHVSSNAQGELFFWGIMRVGTGLGGRCCLGPLAS